MRGAPVSCVFMVMCQGLIPAHAGSTLSAVQGQLCGGAHPRACGEHHQPRILVGFFQGSSPRMRGAQKTRGLGPALLGLIPAHAGSTSGSYRTGRTTWAHPRACGEHHYAPGEDPFDPGSSPRMRGAHPRKVEVADPLRLIPAHAGSTGAVVRGDTNARAHPRACGEHGKGLPFFL